MPELPESVDRNSAQAYVQTYEEHRIHNELLGEDMSEEHEGYGSMGSDRDVVKLDIEPLEIELLRDAPHGYYFITSISGRAEHWCQDRPPKSSDAQGDEDPDEKYGHGCGSSIGIHNHAVVHFVASNHHMRIPYN